MFFVFDVIIISFLLYNRQSPEKETPKRSDSRSDRRNSESNTRESHERKRTDENQRKRDREYDNEKNHRRKSEINIERTNKERRLSASDRFDTGIKRRASEEHQTRMRDENGTRKYDDERRARRDDMYKQRETSDTGRRKCRNSFDDSKRHLEKSRFDERDRFIKKTDHSSSTERKRSKIDNKPIVSMERLDNDSPNRNIDNEHTSIENFTHPKKNYRGTRRR